MPNDSNAPEPLQVGLVDPAPGFRRLLASQIGGGSSVVHEAGTAAQGMALLESHPEIEVVVIATELPDECGFGLAHRMKRRRRDHLRVVLLGERITPEDLWHAAQAGADACLAKPVNAMEIAAALLRSGSAPVVERSSRAPIREPIRVSHASDPVSPGSGGQLCWWLRDLSMAGAFLETQGPVTPGTPLRIELDLAGEACSLDATVVREQAPSWRAPGGVGVLFHGLSPGTRRALARALGDGSEPHWH
ncbi:MAG: response regulator [Myxococcota bacterium]